MYVYIHIYIYIYIYKRGIVNHLYIIYISPPNHWLLFNTDRNNMK